MYLWVELPGPKDGLMFNFSGDCQKDFQHTHRLYTFLLSTQIAIPTQPTTQTAREIPCGTFHYSRNNS